MIFRKIAFYLGFVFYVLITVKERRMKVLSDTYDVNVTRMKQYLGSTEIWYIPGEKHKRRYLTFKEYKRIHYPMRKQS